MRSQSWLSLLRTGGRSASPRRLRTSRRPLVKKGWAREPFEPLEPRHALSAAPAITPRNIGVPDRVPGNASTLERIAVGGSVQNAINFGGDRDWYRISLEAGRSYQFRLNSSAHVPGVRALSDAYLYLRNSAGTILRQDDDSGGGNNSLITFTASSTGTYFLDAAGYNNSHFGTYTLSAAIVGAADDFAGSTATNGSVAVNGSIAGVVNTGGDRDWFRVWLVAGRSYRFDVNRGTISDPDLRFRNGFGAELRYDDDSGGNLNPRITYRPASTGFFYLDVGGRFNTNVGSYTLRVTQV
jgi:hypothetical protein